MFISRVNEFHAAQGHADELLAFLMTIKEFIAASAGCEMCEVLQKNDDVHTFIVLEKWASKEDHKKSLESFPQEKMADIMPLMDRPPKGAFYHHC